MCHTNMVGLNSIITTVLLFPICKCPITGNSSAMSPVVFTRYNTTSEWWLNPDRWQKKFLRSRYKKEEQDLKVIANSFDLGMTVLAVAAAVSEQDRLPHLDPTLAYYHTTAYRWMLRQLSMYPDLIYNKVFELHKVWRHRFYFEDALVPQWLRKPLVWVDRAAWDQEEDMLKKFNIYGKRTFDKYDRYPPKKFVSNETFSQSASMFYPGPFDNNSYSEEG